MIRLPDPRDVALELARRVGNVNPPAVGPRADASECQRIYVVRLSNPVTAFERLQLTAARLQRCPIVIMPHHCNTVDEWMERYGWMKGH